MSFTQTAQTAPIRVLADEIRLLHRSTESSSQMSVMVVDVPPGSFVPPHSHACEEEAYFMLEGELQLMVGGAQRALGSGDFAHVPATTLHGYSNGSDETARFLAWTVGGPIDEFFVAMSQSVKEMPRDGAVMAEIAERFGISMAGPPS